jgi:hypothetical protein
MFALALRRCATLFYALEGQLNKLLREKRPIGPIAH